MKIKTRTATVKSPFMKCPPICVEGYHSQLTRAIMRVWCAAVQKESKIAVFVALFLFSSVAVAQSKTESSLQKVRANLAKTTDPVSRTKLNIKISSLLIALMFDAARSGDDKVVDERLNDYSNTIQDANRT